MPITTRAGRGLAASVLLMALSAAPAATAGAPSLDLSPSSGAPGTSVGVTGSGYTTGATVEVHWDSLAGPLLATTMVGGNSISTSITIPTVGPGSYQVWTCETTFVACTDTSHEFWVGGSAGFQVTAPPTTSPPTTTPPTTVPVTLPPGEDTADLPFDIPIFPLAGCIPTGATVIDFDDMAEGMQFVDAEIPGVAYGPTVVRGTPIQISSRGVRWGNAEPGRVISGPSGPEMEYPAVRRGDLSWVMPPSHGTVSPPLAVLSDGFQRFEVERDVDFVGVHVGYPDLPGGFDAEDPLTITMTVQHVPYTEADGTLVTGEWGSKSITYGPEHNPVSNCLLIEAPEGIESNPLDPRIQVHLSTTYRGSGADWTLGLDNVFFGSRLDPAEECSIPAGATIIDFDDMAEGFTFFEDNRSGLVFPASAHVGTPPEIARHGIRWSLSRPGTLVAGTPDPTTVYPPERRGRLTEISALGVSTESPPHAALSDGVQFFEIERDVDYVGVFVGNPVPESFVYDYPLTITLTVDHVPFTDLGGRLITSRLGSDSFTHPPDDRTVTNCLFVSSDGHLVNPHDPRIQVQVWTSRDGARNDWTLGIDRIFFGTYPDGVSAPTDPSGADTGDEPIAADTTDPIEGSGVPAWLWFAFAAAVALAGFGGFALGRRR